LPPASPILATSRRSKRIHTAEKKAVREARLRGGPLFFGPPACSSGTRGCARAERTGSANAMDDCPLFAFLL
jgi:hypothetical protein